MAQPPPRLGLAFSSANRSNHQTHGPLRRPRVQRGPRSLTAAVSLCNSTDCSGKATCGNPKSLASQFRNGLVDAHQPIHKAQSSIANRCENHFFDPVVSSQRYRGRRLATARWPCSCWDVVCSATTNPFCAMHPPKRRRKTS
jgi:hypothetical protein